MFDPYPAGLAGFAATSVPVHAKIIYQQAASSPGSLVFVLQTLGTGKPAM